MCLLDAKILSALDWVDLALFLAVAIWLPLFSGPPCRPCAAYEFPGTAILHHVRVVGSARRTARPSHRQDRPPTDLFTPSGSGVQGRQCPHRTAQRARVARCALALSHSFAGATGSGMLSGSKAQSEGIWPYFLCGVDGLEFIYQKIESVTRIF